MVRCALSVLCLAIWINVQYVGCIIHGGAMRYKVTMKLYSGRDDPSWDIDNTHPSYNQIASAVNNAPSSNLASGLGYCGYQVVAEDAFGQQVWKTLGRGRSRRLESMLAGSCGNLLSPAALQHVKTGIYRHISSHRPQQVVTRIVVVSEDKKRKKRQAVCRRPSFDPDNWNIRHIRRRNNCYNYATNIRTDTFAQPGRGSGQRYTQTTVQNVRAAAIRDGFVPLTPGDISSTGYCVVALVIWEGEDYHFLRLDNNGYWSQKSGQTHARNRDDSNNLVADPRTSDRGPYTQFGGFMGVHGGVTIR